MSGESRHRGRSSDVEESGRCKSSTKIRSSSRDSSRRRDKHRQSSSDEDDDRNGHRRSDRNYDRNRHISPHRDERRRRHDSTNRDGADKRDKGKGGERDERYRKEKRGSDDAENSGRRHKDKPSYADDDRGRRGSKKSGRSEKDTSLRDNEVARGGSRRRSISEDNRPGEQRDLGENNREKNGRKSGGSESDKDGRHRDSEALTIHDEKDRETQENDKSRGGENVVQRRVGRTAAEKPQTDSYGRQINYNREAHEREKEKLDADKAKFDKVFLVDSCHCTVNVDTWVRIQANYLHM
ncbi:hypothetical protein SARC_00658 [Sphaeroforma arctica JP610]|uniref:Uncharacterized protein n=1 Tax=Sphaeroforma arctica JP610 TaxID=667725 RepID=A0A0L0GG13_9EUKA|nr:hypothetical protein SARC_00658 [Sphaeroforma arctica JP610]KNC87223.1 hypothetical protein SARC_00658 [Sphaeroforma arctica JP610]|eukprot:XP_014161125.1 hypothetical protein SARC_00658 [Sphaeroforma arctica JP610]